LAVYVGYVLPCAGCFSGRLGYRFSLVRLRPTRLGLTTWLFWHIRIVLLLFGRVG